MAFKNDKCIKIGGAEPDYLKRFKRRVAQNHGFRVVFYPKKKK